MGIFQGPCCNAASNDDASEERIMKVVDDEAAH